MDQTNVYIPLEQCIYPEHYLLVQHNMYLSGAAVSIPIIATINWSNTLFLLGSCLFVKHLWQQHIISLGCVFIY